MSNHSFIITYPNELFRLFVKGEINDPEGNRWNISFCPGIKSSWSGFVNCWKFSWEIFKWSWDIVQYIEIIKFMWEIFVTIFVDSAKYISRIPEGIFDGFSSIRSLWNDAPIAWIARVLLRLGWNCFTWPIIKLVLGATGMFISPIVFIVGSTIGCVGKFVAGHVVAIISAVLSNVVLLGGILVSGLITIGAMSSRFPKQSDNGLYGLHIKENLV